MDNIHPTSELLPKEAKQKILRQKSCCVWLTGLSGSGKTTIAIDLEVITSDRELILT
jgi:adenylylsulfate kinase